MIDEISAVRIREKSKKLNANDQLRCLFYKEKTCKPYQVQFKICIKCHRCKALTIETAVPRLFDKIVDMALGFMTVFGMKQSPPSEQNSKNPEQKNP